MVLGLFKRGGKENIGGRYVWTGLIWCIFSLFAFVKCIEPCKWAWCGQFGLSLFKLKGE